LIHYYAADGDGFLGEVRESTTLLECKVATRTWQPDLLL
jgi:hypothetical protein